MITIEAHRAAIGGYYNRAYHASNKSEINDEEENGCNCKYLVENCDIDVIKIDDYADFKCRFYKYLAGCFEQISLELKSVDETKFEYGYYNHLLDCYGKIRDVVDDPSYLKILKLLIDGDIESNPGPVTNNDMSTPKGRPKKRSGFRGTPRKLDFTSLVNKSQENVKQDLRNKVSIIQSDITKVKCDAIVNAANVTLLGGGGIDGFIHKAAGPLLKKKCKKLVIKGKSINGEIIRCYPGRCEVTDTVGTKLTNSRYVFHTVGPNANKEMDMNRNTTILRSCYESCLQNVLDYNRL